MTLRTYKCMQLALSKSPLPNSDLTTFSNKKDYTNKLTGIILSHG